MDGIGGDLFYRNLAYGSAEKVASLQRDREQYNTARKQQHTQNIMSGAIAGATLGAQTGNPYGIAIGAVVGGLSGSFL